MLSCEATVVVEKLFVLVRVLVGMVLEIVLGRVVGGGVAGAAEEVVVGALGAEHLADSVAATWV